MAYKVLYRKYRPQDFNSLYGQDNIKKLLIESIKNNQIAHAYLFSGPRGTGKTSTAKLFAKTINCENPIDGIPCNNCPACNNYEQSADIIEIDAASNNGVDEIRELRNNAKILPTFSKYKIYIIDEVHMLSQSAWNAFLKILEEPPKHVIFILATTEIQKVPITILSRCQRFNFQRINTQVIYQNLEKISKEENIEIEEDALKYIAELADGGMRDALSVLDQLSKEKQKITVDLIQQTFGVISLQDISRIFELLNENKIEEFNTYFNDYLNRGLDTNILINKILNQIYLEEIKIKNGNHSFISLENLKKLANEIVNCYNKKDGLILIKIILLSYFPNKNTTETLSPELIDSNNNQPTQEIIKKELPIIKKEEKSQNSDENEKIESEPENSTDLLNLQAIRINNAFAEASKESKQEFLKNWDDFKKKIELENKIELLSIIEDASIEVASSKNVIFSNSSKSGTIIFNENLHEIEKEFNKKNKSKYKFICLDQEKWTEEKLDYIKNKNTKEYKYIDEETIINNHNSINEAFDIFENDIIEVN